MLKTCRCGSIYTLSLMPGSIISGNVMDDCKVKFGGLYLDEGSGGFKEIKNNIATDSVYQAYFYHLVSSPQFDNRQPDDEEINKNNYLKTGSMEDAAYKAIWDNAGVFTLAEDRRFEVSADTEVTGGTVSVAPLNARAGEIITITAVAASGYELERITATVENPIIFNDGETIKMIMPDEKEIVSAVFKVKEDKKPEKGSDTNTGSDSESSSSTSGTSKSDTGRTLVETVYSPNTSSAQNPETGDHASIVPYVICMLAAGAIIALMCYCRKRERK